MTGPFVAHVAPNGMVGKAFIPIFVDAAIKGEIEKLKFITSKETAILKEAVTSASNGNVEFVVIDYTDKRAFLAALQGVDIVVSTMGWNVGQLKSEQALIEAALEARVKVYFNSDFGVDYDEGTWGAPVLEGKETHVAAARAAGLRTVSIANGVFMPFLRTSFLGVNGHEWEIAEDGNSSYALIDISDAGRYTLRAIMLAHQDPSRIPDRVRVYGDSKTLNEYASIVESLTKTPVSKKYVSRSQLVAEWECPNGKKDAPFLFLRIMAGTNAADLLGREHNELLNPGHRYFTPISYEEFVKSTL
ncbi:NAD(P)-binding protein [Clavulina sp. PMI_390]|nr:NAD(P)-binding protein [Clavulina sp. PMI_390]